MDEIEKSLLLNLKNDFNNRVKPDSQFLGVFDNRKLCRLLHNNPPNLDLLKYELVSTNLKVKYIISPSCFIEEYDRNCNNYITKVDITSYSSIIKVDGIYISNVASIIKGLITDWYMHRYICIVMENDEGKLFNNIICYNPFSSDYDEKYKFY